MSAIAARAPSLSQWQQHQHSSSSRPRRRTCPTLSKQASSFPRCDRALGYACSSASDVAGEAAAGCRHMTCRRHRQSGVLAAHGPNAEAPCAHCGYASLMLTQASACTWPVAQSTRLDWTSLLHARRATRAMRMRRPTIVSRCGECHHAGSCVGVRVVRRRPSFCLLSHCLVWSCSAWEVACRGRIRPSQPQSRRNTMFLPRRLSHLIRQLLLLLRRRHRRRDRPPRRRPHRLRQLCRSHRPIRCHRNHHHSCHSSHSRHSRHNRHNRHSRHLSQLHRCMPCADLLSRVPPCPPPIARPRQRGKRSTAT